jgi:hypothetical protein
MRALCAAWVATLAACATAGCGTILGISDLPGLDGGGAGLDSTSGQETAPDGEPLAIDSGSASDGFAPGGGDAATNAGEAGFVREASTASSSGGSSSGGGASSSSGSGGSTGSSSSGSSASSSSGSTGSSSGSSSSSGGVRSSGGSGSGGASSGSGSSSGSGVTSCCTGLNGGTECCQYGEAFCVDAGQTWVNIGTGCSPGNTNGAVTDPSCVGTIVVCQ